MNSDIARRLGRRSFLSAFGVLTLAACSGGASDIIGSKPLSSAKNPDVVILPCPNCVPTIPTLPTNMSELTPAQVAAMTAAQIKALSSGQIASFSDHQLHYITNAQAFHGSQAKAILQRVAASQGAHGPYPQPPNSGSTPTPPVGYMPPIAGSNFWGWVGGIIGSAVGGAVGATAGAAAGPPGSWIGGLLGGDQGASLGAVLGGGSFDAQYIFWNSDTGAWNGIDLGDCCTGTSENGNTGQTSLDSDGVTVTGSFSASCSPSDAKRRYVDSSGCAGTLTITVIAN